MVESWTFPDRHHVLWELSADPCGGVENLADPIALRVAGQQVRVVQQSGHLSHGEASDGFDADGDVQHLRGD